MVYETVLPLLRTEMAKKGTVVLSVPMGKGGDISAFGQAIEVLEKEFSEHMSSSFDQAWVTYLNFPGMLHADFCRKVFKSVMMSRWEGSEPTQVILFNSKLEEHETLVDSQCGCDRSMCKEVLPKQDIPCPSEAGEHLLGWYLCNVLQKSFVS